MNSKNSNGLTLTKLNKDRFKQSNRKYGKLGQQNYHM